MPNTVAAVLHVEMSAYRDRMAFYIYNAVGQVVSEGSALNGQAMNVDIAQLPVGQYILALKLEQAKAIVKPFVKY